MIAASLYGPTFLCQSSAGVSCSFGCVRITLLSREKASGKVESYGVRFISLVIAH